MQSDELPPVGSVWAPRKGADVCLRVKGVVGGGVWYEVGIAAWSGDGGAVNVLPLAVTSSESASLEHWREWSRFAVRVDQEGEG